MMNENRSSIVIRQSSGHMRVLIQRVTKGSVTVDGKRVSEIGRGLAILVGVGHGDGVQQAEWLAEKTANLRIFEDEAGKMNKSVLEVGGSALVVSQGRLARRPYKFGVTHTALSIMTAVAPAASIASTSACV